MESRATHIIEQLTTRTGLSVDWLRRMTYVLSRNDRFIHQKRRDLTAADLASLLNTCLMGTTVAALNADDQLSRLEYRGSQPPGKAPVFAEPNWRTLLEILIENAPSPAEPASVILANEVRPNTLPNVIEVTTTVPAVSLIWYSKDGTPAQIDWYGPEDATTIPVGIARKAAVSGQIIGTLAEILRTPTMNKRPGKRAAVQNNAVGFGEPTAPTNRTGASTAPSHSLPVGTVTRFSGNRQVRDAASSGIFSRSLANDKFHPGR